VFSSLLKDAAAAADNLSCDKTHGAALASEFPDVRPVQLRVSNQR